MLITKGPSDRRQIVSARADGPLSIGRDAWASIEKALNAGRCTPEHFVERVGINGTLKLGRAWGCVATVVVGHETMRCGIGDPHATVLRDGTGDERVSKVQHGNIDVLRPGETLKHVATLLTAALADAGLSPDALRCIVLAIPGPVRGGRVVGAVWPQWRAQDVRLGLRQQLGEAYDDVPIEIENDANVAAVGEYFYGVGRGSRALLGVKVSGGVGAGLVQDSVLYRGGNGTAGEFGHDYVTVDWIKAERRRTSGRRHPHLPDGLAELARNARCHRCGDRSHVEAYTSGTAIIHRLEPSVDDDPSPDRYTRRIDRVMEVLRHGGPDLDRVSVAIADAGFVLGEALVPVINFADPDVVVLTGAMRDAGPQYLDKVEQRVEDRASALIGTEPPRFLLSEDDWSAVRGAIRLGIERHPPRGIPADLCQQIRATLQDAGPASRAAIPLLGPADTAPDPAAG
jgi:glucokinase